MCRIVRRALLAGTVILSAAAAAAPPDQSSELSRLLGGTSQGFPKATKPRHFAFPDDHGPHASFRNEWWYVTGNLDAADGRRFGFELTFFRFALSPLPPADDSAWRSNQAYIAHFAVSDPDGDRFLVAERMSRGALGLAGAQRRPFRVSIDDWRIAQVGTGSADHWHLAAQDDRIALALDLRAQKLPVLNGVGGLSQKSAEPGNASYYYSVTRWLSDGTLRIDDENYQVNGLSWLDREWGSSALAGNQRGWDWFALQLSDGSDLMFYSIRTDDGDQDAQSAGTWIAQNGNSRPICRSDIALHVLERWQSPQGGTYPSRWRLLLPREKLDIEIVPVMPDQELFTTVRYWEGAVDVRGTHGEQPVSGRGYVELTGYAESKD